MEVSSGGLRPCSKRVELPEGEGALQAPEEHNGGALVAAEKGRTVEVSGPSLAVEGMRRERRGKGQRGSPSSSVSSSFPSSSSSSRRARGGGVHLRIRRRRVAPPPADGDGRGGDDLQGLALPLGMSFAAVVAQVIDRKNVDGESIPADRLSTICSLAVKEAVENVYGKKFGSFLRNFEKSFCSTLKTLQVIQEGYICGQQNHSSRLVDCCEEASVQGTSGSLNAVEDVQENCPLTSVDNQLVLHTELNQQLSHLSRERNSSGLSQSVLSTLEKSVMEQARSNDLKAVEIGLTIRKLQLKKSQLDLSLYASFLERVKISMGISKACFKEEKLKNQMKDLRHADLVRRCIDLLVAGLIVMSCFLVYGAYTYSYRRITEATESCITTAKEPKSWWVPKQVASFSSGWLLLRCHVVVISRMSFGLLMILAVAYAALQRSANTGSAMPVTFILLLLGGACGAAGKFCVDTLGGNGYHWLFYWAIYCSLHFFANAFPAALYYVLHGPVSISTEAQNIILPYWVRRFTFYAMLVLMLPMLSGLMPFASINEWQDHIVSKVKPFQFWRGDLEES